MAILFGVCVVEFKVDPITPLSDIVMVFDGVPGVDCERTLPANERQHISLTFYNNNIKMYEMMIYTHKDYSICLLFHMYPHMNLKHSSESLMNYAEPKWKEAKQCFLVTLSILIPL